MSDGKIYIVRTDLGPEDLHDVAMQIYAKWLEFALGEGALGGKTLKHPTGRYAAAISVTQEQDGSYLIYADDDLPEAGILESGHQAFDLKTRFQQGRLYPMHRGGEFTGYASISYDHLYDSTAWILPAMPAYAPARILADLARQAVS